MPDPLAGLPPRFLRTPEAARFLGLSGRTLEKHRTYGTGPKYRKIGGRVVYALDDLKAWADLGAKTSTSDPGAGTGTQPSAARYRVTLTARRIVVERTAECQSSRCSLPNSLHKISALVAERLLSALRPH
jgi:predicted DNA-binding transcriptional regulator AlpA